MVRRRQYVAITSGMKSAIMETESGPAAVVIYGLPLAATASDHTSPTTSTRRATKLH